MARRGWIVSLLVLAILVLGGCTRPHTYSGTVVEPPFEVPAFTLTDTRGQPYELRPADGEVTLVYFGFTNCPDVCPLTLARLKEALATMSDQELFRVRVVFVTVDPERDTPPVIARFLSAFDPGWIGLTSDRETLTQLWKAYGVYAQASQNHQANHEGDANYEVAHTDRIFAFTEPTGYRLILHGDTPAETLAADVRALLQE